MYQRPVTIIHIQIKIKILNPSQEPPASSKALNEDLKDMDVDMSELQSETVGSDARAVFIKLSLLIW